MQGTNICVIYYQTHKASSWFAETYDV